MEAGSSRPSREDPENAYPDNDSRPDPRRYSTSSTIGSRRRSQYYESQRIERRSRPTSGASQITARSKGKHSSYSAPDDFDNLDEIAVPLPTQPISDRPNLEDARGRKSFQQQASPARNFSQRDGVRKRTASSVQQDQNLSEVAALPPIPRTATAAPNEKETGGAPHVDESDDTGALPSFPSRRSEEPVQDDRQPEPVPKLLTDLYTISYLIFFSIFGTLARLGVQWLTFYPGAPLVTPVVWANLGGSVMMGFLAEDQGLFRDGSIRAELAGKGQSLENFEKLTKKELSSRKKTIPLYIGLATGFCGSFTSFSSFMRDVFLALSNNLPTPIDHSYSSQQALVPSPSSTVSRNGGYAFEALLGVIISTVALSLGGLIVGAHMAIALEGITPTISKTFTRKFLDPLMVLLGWGCWLGAILLVVFPPDRPGGPSSRGTWTNETWRGEVLFVLVFAPVGCLLRFYASLKLNGLVPAFPLGTFAVNMFGTAIEGMCYDIQHVGVGIMGQLGGGRVGCQVLQGVQDGFCGSLTTISTWVAEINGLRRKHGYVYAFSSVAGGFCLMVVIMGSVRWSVGFSSPACNTGYPNKVHG